MLSAQQKRTSAGGKSSDKSRIIVLYDGECGFCTGMIRWLRRSDWGQQLAFLSLHDPSVVERFPGVDHDRLTREMLVMDQQGKQYWGADAVCFLTRQLPTLWAFVPILHFPGTRSAWRLIYPKIAANRYRISSVLGCKSGVCGVPQQRKARAS